eukprot:Tamp_09173.p2 GENE.Tamp_09173~~Tamp_09173.p2  ORF type:complete len:152 (+),score=10.48 Tamp_09173:1714-2169(+)
MPCKMASMRKGCQHDLQKRQKGGKRIVAGVVDPRRYWYCVVLLERVGNRRIVHNDHLAQVLPNRADVFEKIAVLPARMQKRSKCACKMSVLSCSLHWWPRGTGGLVALVPWLHSWPLAAACHQPSLAPWLKLMHALAWRQGRQAGTHANRA